MSSTVRMRVAVMYKIHARVSQGASGLHAVERVVEVMYTLQRCDGVNSRQTAKCQKKLVEYIDP